ncbi:helix-turn-helix domain-containing protein [Kitasatospora paranensis]|uniref:Helix-turn-helix domain-containing protein n=1 Tax=Kitasatospora paranensis TaxID=258053 RepID=A0ABW2FUR7_9ACTN
MSSERKSGGEGSALSPGARALYLHALRTGGRLADHTARDLTDDAAEAAPGGDALQELLALGLLTPEVGPPGTFAIKDPRQLAESLSGDLQARAADLLLRSIALNTALHNLGPEYQAHTTGPEKGGAIEYVQGRGNINQLVATLLEGCTKEMLTAQPGGGRGVDALKIAIDRDMKFVQRGGTIRTIYQPSARYSNPTIEYVREVTQEGCQVRTLDEAFHKLIVLDREVAVVTVGGEENRDSAAFIRDEAVLSYIVGVFDSQWERAIPFTGVHEIPRAVVSSMRRQIIRLMLQGVGHRTIARRLGLSERTLARHIAELREEYEVETLFQLGWKLAQNAEGPMHLDASTLPLDSPETPTSDCHPERGLPQHWQ